MAQATTKKLQKAQAVTVDTEESKRFETVPIKMNNVRTLKGYKYYNPISRLISFEKEKHDITLKMINKTALKNDGNAQSFTAVVNDGLDLILYVRGKIKIEDVSPEVLEICKMIFKQPKNKSKKQTKVN